MNRFLILAGLFFCCLNSRGQYPGYTEVKNAESFKKSFLASTSATESIQADFIQEKTLTMLSEKIVSSGKFCFRKKDRLRMEYVQPYPYLLILNGGKIYVRDGQKESKISAGSNPVFQQVNRILIDCVSGNMLDNPEFQYRIFENAGSWLIEFKPMASNLKEHYKNINIVLDKKDFTASAIGIYDATGDKTIMRFQNKQLNAQIPDSQFNIP
jgi:outer membrane lipoprotein-sorting protein